MDVVGCGDEPNLGNGKADTFSQISLVTLYALVPAM